MSPPLLSIGLPTRNRAGLLARAVPNLLALRYHALELVISDNASTDETPAVCRNLAAADPRIRVLRHEIMLPPFQNFRAAMEATTGEYFMWASDDDAWDPEFASTLTSILEAEPRVALAAAEAEYRLPDGTPLLRFAEGGAFRGPDRRGSLGRVLHAGRRGYGNLIYGIYRRTTLLRSSGVSILEGVTFTNELPVFTHVAQFGELRVIPRVLFYKTAPAHIYRGAAAEYGVHAAHREDDGPRDGPVRSFAVWTRYHLRTLADVARCALRLERLGLAARVLVLGSMAAQLFLHFAGFARFHPAPDRPRP